MGCSCHKKTNSTVAAKVVRIGSAPGVPAAQSVATLSSVRGTVRSPGTRAGRTPAHHRLRAGLRAGR